MWLQSFIRTHKFRYDSLACTFSFIDRVICAIPSTNDTHFPDRITWTRRIVSLYSKKKVKMECEKLHDKKLNNRSIFAPAKRRNVYDNVNVAIFHVKIYTVSRILNVKFSSNKPDPFHVWGRLWRDVGDDARAGQDMSAERRAAKRKKGDSTPAQSQDEEGRESEDIGRATSGGGREAREIERQAQERGCRDRNSSPSSRA